MIGLDTNVLVRVLTRDDPHQLALAKRYIADNFSAQNPAFINRVVVVEVVWVLEGAYTEYTRDQIAGAVDGLLNTAEFTVEDASAIRSATKAYRAGADFSDAVIAVTNGLQGCATTATFDKSAKKKLAHFVELR